MNKFEIDICNYFDKDITVAEIYYDRVQWAEILQHENKLIAKFYAHPKQEYWEFSCEEAEAAIAEAKGRLLAKINPTKSLFPATSKEPEEANRIGQQLLEEILNHPDSQILSNRFGGIDVFHPSGKGARFNNDKDFLGFLQLRS